MVCHSLGTTFDKFAKQLEIRLNPSKSGGAL
jgi:hypothetical protein